MTRHPPPNTKPTATGHNAPAIALSVTGSLTGLLFITLGGTKLNGVSGVVPRFTEWGDAGGFLMVAGAIEVVLGLLLFHAPTRRFGALGLVAWISVAILTQIRAGDARFAVLSAALLVLFAAIATVEVRRRGWRVPAPPAPLRQHPERPGEALLFVFQLVGVSFLIRWAIGGTLFWSALPFLALGHVRTAQEGHTSQRFEEVLLLYLLVLGIGVSGVWGFVGHFLMSDSVAQSIGWATDSPFQQELAFYHLGLGISGLLALWIRDRFWLAIGLVASVFLYGAGLVHLMDFLDHANTAKGNWGSGVLLGNVIIPTALLWLLARRSSGRPVYARGV